MAIRGGDWTACRRSIPACAGEPLPGIVKSATPEVYPRVCGGTAPPYRRHISSAGLSPRVRGNPVAGESEIE